MARRNAEKTFQEFMVALAGLLALGMVFAKNIVNALFAFIFVILLFIVIVGVVFFLIKRWYTASKKRDSAVLMASIPPAVTFLVTKAESQASRSSSMSTAEPQPKPLENFDIHKKLHSIDWFQFEKIMAIAYRKKGYLVDLLGGANPDGGIDLIISKDGQKTAIQCKHWKSWNIGVKTIREFLGALTASGIKDGLFISIGKYTAEAHVFAEKQGITLMGETGILELFESTDAQFDPEMLYLLNDTQKYCPKCGKFMVLRTATKGLNVGSQFWGCSSYPRCRFTLQSTPDLGPRTSVLCL